jgi:photosystem II stability/assembly factor-like uncharacterized protein
MKSRNRTLLGALLFGAAGCTTTPSLPPTSTPASASPGVSTSTIDVAGVAPSGAIWTIGGDALALSADLGSTWRRASLPVAQTPDRPLPVFVLDATHAWVITVTPGSVDSGNGPAFDHVHLIVNRTGDGGQTWQTASVPGDYPDTERSVVFADAGHGYLMVSGGRTNQGSSTILRSEDGGATWTIAQAVEAGDQGSLGSLLAVSEGTTLWAAAQGEAGPVNHPILAVSRDGGRTWATVGLPGVLSRWGGAQNLPLGPPAFLTGELGLFALTSSDEATTGDTSGNPRTLVYSTADGGNTWTQRASVAFDAGGSMAFLSATGWIASVQGLPATLEVTTDGGATWQAVNPTGVPAGSFETIAAIDGTRLLGLILTGGNSGNPHVLALSADGGATWQTIGE